MLEQLTFLLAVIGYAGLTVTAVLVSRGRSAGRLWHVAALIIVAHVALVWAVRYEWRFAAATRNGYAGFLVFHGALALIVASIVVREHIARWLVSVAFAVVSLGALGAVFRYDVVQPYRAPVIVIAVGGVVGLARAHRLRRHRARRAA